MQWNDVFDKIKEEDYSKKLNAFLNEEYKTKVIYPPRSKMFNAFLYTPLDKVKVVILGQDPYHEKGQAVGLAFSVPDGVELPPSLQNIYKEIGNEYHEDLSKCSGDLTYLTKQGVLLINPILSVVEHRPLSHKCKEYELFFNEIMGVLNKQEQPIVFLLWGNNARAFKSLLNNPNHLILESVHPSPLSANRGGWFGNNRFIKCNEFLVSKGLVPIDWIPKKIN